jgi:predicted nucleic acid-binding protein
MAALVDTNVLVYAHDRDAGDNHVRAIALVARLAQSAELVVSAQILNEFANVLHRKRKLDRALVATAVANVSQRATVLALTGEFTALALGPGMGAGLSFWDALVWATAHANGIGIVYTEDFEHGRVVDSVRFIDPFRSE